MATHVSTFKKHIFNNVAHKIYNNRGLIHYACENYVKALEDFNKAIELCPEDSDFYYNRITLNGNVNSWPKVLSDNGGLGPSVGIGDLNLGGNILHSSVKLEVSESKIYTVGSLKSYVPGYYYEDRIIGARRMSWNDFSGEWGALVAGKRIGWRIDADDEDANENCWIQDLNLDSEKNLYVFWVTTQNSNVWGQRVRQNPDPESPNDVILDWNNGQNLQINQNTIPNPSPDPLYRLSPRSFIDEGKPESDDDDFIYITWFTNENDKQTSHLAPEEDVYGQKLNFNTGEKKWSSDRPYVYEGGPSENHSQIRTGSFAAAYLTSGKNPLVMINMFGFLNAGGFEHANDYYDDGAEYNAKWFADVRVDRFDPTNTDPGQIPSDSNINHKLISFDPAGYNYEYTTGAGAWYWDYIVSKQINCNAASEEDFQSGSNFGRCQTDKKIDGKVWKINFTPTLPAAIDADSDGIPDSADIDIKYYVRTSHTTGINENGFDANIWQEIEEADFGSDVVLARPGEALYLSLIHI